ncbi:SDR family NAD(P)-dependent oxidoreductase [Actinosynnema sp. NPDC047251]|uniref:Polyketide synthase type I n=1 Tax=Saccharothrix espanaensis (strain ATCC 51144 / DSM 44229 / JCM 9112 / NBRC 15066 / NRRL 15764) TaxID=1179773 RepID=K0K8B3_SACES|nr:type I polyketide synthase [Saccharothrix espanaensis]CCH32918.1 Polyketide synthase type I [Saccharothrix espanaensis DSM 44229]
MSQHSEADDQPDRVAVVGMAGRFPGADSVAALWRLLTAGEEAVTRFTPQEPAAAGVPADLAGDPAHVPAKGALSDVEGFDAELFGYSAAEAALLDPQHRLFLECALTAVEDAGLVPDRGARRTGVYAGGMFSSYLAHNLLPRPDLVSTHGMPMVLQANLPDQLAARVAYQLGLHGPAVGVQTACSTSLVAVHLAAQALLAQECDVALAGGVTVTVPARVGYRHTEGGMESATGRCRPFSAEADGTVFGNGVGVVVLKRLTDALADGDPVHAVLLGSAINNDGHRKVGYTAPSYRGQVEVIREALAIAGVDPATVGHVEAHGTGTPLGDPIEVAALAETYGAAKPAVPRALGSVKSNLGHLDAAAGITGLIKTVLMLRHGRVPASLHADPTHPELDLVGAGFFVPGRLQDWPVITGPRRAAVSAFGIGGTNAHIVLEQAPARDPRAPVETGPVVLPLSAASSAALAAMTGLLGAHLAEHGELHLADVAHTLRTGRRQWAHRRVVVADSVSAAVDALSTADRAKVASGRAEDGPARPVFLLPGQGSQYPGMGAGLYRSEPVFRAAVDECADLLVPHLGLDLRAELWAEDDGLSRTRLTQPAVFTTSYAAARLLLHWGVTPAALLGHSLGEYTAACLAGIFTLPDALRLVAGRGRLMAAMPPGAMLALPLDAEAAAELAGRHGLDVAAVNGPRSTVVSGPIEAVVAAEETVATRGLRGVRLPTSHAFHSRLTDTAQEELAALLAEVTPHPPTIPVLSNLTGDWLTGTEALDRSYWLRQMRAPVRFLAGLTALGGSDAPAVAVEAGPGGMLTGLVHAAQVPGLTAATPPLPSAAGEPGSARLAFGSLWAHGVPVDWDRLGDPGGRTAILPTYPFQHRRHWVEPAARAAVGGDEATLGRFGWRATTVEPDAKPVQGKRSAWLLFLDADGRAQALADVLTAAGQVVTTVLPGAEYRRVRRGVYELDPARPEHYRQLFAELRALVRTPSTVLYCWPLAPSADDTRDYFGLVRLARAVAAERVVHDLRLGVVTSGAFAVTGAEHADPVARMLSGPVLVLPTEYHNLDCVQLDLPAHADGVDEATATALTRAVLGATDPVLALRGDRWWRREPARATAPPADSALPVRRGGVYLIVGGLTGIGAALAERLTTGHGATVVLLSRSAHEDHPTVRALADAGATVAAERADVSDVVALTAALDRVRARFGRIDGVVHAAGVAGGGAVERRTDLEMAGVLAPKVAGARTLLAALRPGEADFVVLCSSLAAVVPTYGQCDYSAANAYLDGLAESRSDGRLVLSAAWDTWGETGMLRDAEVPGDLRAAYEEVLARALTTAQGVRAFEALLAGRGGHVLVARAGIGEPLDLGADGPWSTGGGVTTAPRPDLAEPYVAPRGELEAQLAELWQELLGVDDVGVNDNFVQLGGHSLMAAQLAARVRAAYEIEIPVRVFFEGATVAGLATMVEEAVLDQLERS